MDEIDTLVRQADDMVLAGRYREAQALCARALDAEPDHLAALCIAGNASLLLRNYGDAYEHFLMVIALDPDSLDAATGLGLASRGLSRPEEAQMHFRRALELNPGCADLQRLLDAARQAARMKGATGATVSGRAASAPGATGRRPDMAGRNRPEQTATPHAPAPHNLLAQGIAAAGRGQYDIAVTALRRAIAQAPNLTQAYIHLSYALYQQQQFTAAEECCRCGLAFAPDSASLHNNRGMALLAQDRLAEAADSYAQATELDPQMVAAYSNLGLALSRLGRLAEAEAISRAGLALDPDMPDLLENLGLILASRSRDREAMALWRRALAQRPDNARIGFDLGLLELKHGDFAAGWQHYELRAANRQRRFPCPRWRGESLHNRAILVWAEQGLGDTIQFVRYLPLLKARGARVVLEHPPLLGSLLAGMAGADGLVAAAADGRAPRLPDAPTKYDLHIGLLSLPLLLETTPDTVPAAVPYLAAEADRVQAWRQRLEADGHGYRVGIVWAGNPAYANDVFRSFAPDTFAPLATIPGIRLYSLQKGEAALQARLTLPGLPLIDLGPQLHDWAETAAAIVNLDLVISVDTAVAHLAGALGRPVWTLLPQIADWRWLLEREDSPWYPTMRLFRQARLGDWPELMERVQGELSALAAGAIAATDVSPSTSDARISGPQLPTPQLPTSQILAEDERMNLLTQAGEHLSRSRYPEAETLLRRLIDLDPSRAEPYLPLSMALSGQGRFDAAEAICRRGLEVDPNSAPLHHSLALALSLQRRYQDAIPIYRRANALDPTLIDVYANLCSALGRLGQLAEAEAVCRAGLAHRSDSPNLHCNLGMAVEMQGRYEEAQAVYMQGLTLCGPAAQLTLSLGALDLKRGDFANGWRRYELRPAAARSLRQPRWRGEELRDTTILVWDEQGLGDSIQFARYLALLKARGARVVLEHHAELGTLYRGLVGADTLIARPANGDMAADIHYDVQTPLLSLPLLLETTPDTVPAAVPYLAAEADRVQAWRQRLEADGHGYRVGIVWAGNPAYANDVFRSFAPDTFAPLATIPGIRLYSLQKGEAALQARLTLPGLPLIDLGPQLHDWAETAAAIVNLDLVISVDTAVAHLAGALGRPVWTLLPQIADWRWLLEREDSPWYPTMRLFRQARQGDWPELIERVRAALTSQL